MSRIRFGARADTKSSKASATLNPSGSQALHHTMNNLKVISETKNAPIESSQELPEEPSARYLYPGISKHAVASMFRAVQALALADPWYGIPGADTPIRVKIPSMGIDSAVLVKIEAHELSSGFAIFSDEADWHRYLASDEDKDEVYYLELVMDEEDHLSQHQLQEIKEQQWEVENFFGYPDWYAVEPEKGRRAVNKEELERLEVVAWALAHAFSDKHMHHWFCAWGGEACLDLSLQTFTQRGPVTVLVNSPAVGDGSDPLEDLRKLAKEPQPFRLEQGDRAIDELLHRFRFSPEGYGQGLSLAYCEKFLQLLLREYASSVCELSAVQVERVILESFPSISCMSYEEPAQNVLDILRLFYLYLGRKHRLPQGKECAQRLASSKLAERLDRSWGERAA